MIARYNMLFSKIFVVQKKNKEYCLCFISDQAHNQSVTLEGANKILSGAVSKTLLMYEIY